MVYFHCLMCIYAHAIMCYQMFVFCTSDELILQQCQAIDQYFPDRVVEDKCDVW